MADVEDQVLKSAVPKDPDCLALGSESPVQDDVTGEKTSESQDAPNRFQQWDCPPWDRWSRERSTDSRERSVDSRDSATRERDFRYAEERKRDRERGRREEVILYRHRDSESANSDSTEEEEAQCVNESLFKAAASYVAKDNAKSRKTLSPDVLPASHTSVEDTEHSSAPAVHIHLKTAKTSKNSSVGKEATRGTELAKESRMTKTGQ